MLGIRILSKIMNFLNKSQGLWVEVKSQENEGTTVTIYLKSNVQFLNTKKN